MPIPAEEVAKREAVKAMLRSLAAELEAISMVPILVPGSDAEVEFNRIADRLEQCASTARAIGQTLEEGWRLRHGYPQDVSRPAPHG